MWFLSPQPLPGRYWVFAELPPPPPSPPPASTPPVPAPAASPSALRERSARLAPRHSHSHADGVSPQGTCALPRPPLDLVWASRPLLHGRLVRDERPQPRDGPRQPQDRQGPRAVDR